MRTRTSWLKMISLAVVATSLFACANGNGDAPLVDSTGKHPANWISKHGATAASSTSSCTECHGTDLSGGVSRVSCMSTTTNSGFRCHFSSPAVNPGCTSCHGGPPNGPNSTMAPNRQFAHDTHLALPGVTCNYCHFNAGAGTAGHAVATANGGIASATIAFLNVSSLGAKSARTVGPNYDAATGTCSAVICHGGQTTPSWTTGSITVATDCLLCHQQGDTGNTPRTPQYNSFYSGNFTFPNSATKFNLHQLHLSSKDPTFSNLVPIVCTSCHDTGKLTTSQHFKVLTTPAFETAPGSTIGGGNTNVTRYTPYTGIVPSGTCTSNCHATRNWIN